jgi:hypothetical protein
MIPARRQAFNDAFTAERYESFARALVQRCGVPVEFRISETPCFFPVGLMDNLASAAGEMITQLLSDTAYRAAADAIVPARFRMPGGESRPTFIQVDFGLVRAGDRVEGRLVELQAFPSLYGFQMCLAEVSRDTWALSHVDIFGRGLDREAYLRTVGRAITGGHDPAEVVLMEIDPEHQKTRPDFAITEQLWDVRAIDIRSVTREGRRLFYDRDGRRTPIRRIYNRVIPDDLARTGLEIPFDYRDDLDVEWTGGPDWFFRISKFSIPHLRHPWVPETHFLHTLDRMPADRDRWLLKPLFSYAGGGIIFSPSDDDIARIPAAERHLYILQERVSFTPVIDTPHGATQAELRMMFVRDGEDYRFVLPLVRTGRGRMMGVDHNKGLAWVGASAAMMVEAAI